MQLDCQEADGGPGCKRLSNTLAPAMLPDRMIMYSTALLPERGRLHTIYISLIHMNANGSDVRAKTLL